MCFSNRDSTFSWKKHFSILTYLELILKGSSNPALLMSCPQGPFGSWKFDFFHFFKPFVPGVVPAGAFWELEIWLFEFSNPLFRLSCPQGPFGSWKLNFFELFRPFVRLSCPQGPLGAWKFDIPNFSSPLSGCHACRGLWGAKKLTFLIFQAPCPVVVPAGAFWKLEIWFS